MSSEKLRLFVAVDAPPQQIDAVERAVEELRDEFPGARWTRPESQHVTLKFLGWVPADALVAVESTCTTVAVTHGPAQVSLADLGAFPSETRARVLWLGLADPAKLLHGLSADLDRALAPLGFEPEGRGYTPHLTLARFKVPLRRTEPLPSVTIPREPFLVQELHLYRSHLSGRGARYEIVRTFPLRSSPPSAKSGSKQS
jgi:2'-5' RNA ligase